MNTPQSLTGIFIPCLPQAVRRHAVDTFIYGTMKHACSGYTAYKNEHACSGYTVCMLTKMDKTLFISLSECRPQFSSKSS